MTQKKLSDLLKAVTIALGVVGAAVYLFVLPAIGRSLTSEEGFDGWFWPWLLFLWGTAIPLYASLFEFWGICREIGLDNSFCEENATRLKTISLLVLGDVGYFFAGNVVLLLLNMHHPGVLLASLAVDVVGVSVGIAAAALSHLVYKAAMLQEEQDLTV